MVKTAKRLRKVDFVGMINNISNLIVGTTTLYNLHRAKNRIDFLRIGVSVEDKEGLEMLKALDLLVSKKVSNVKLRDSWHEFKDENEERFFDQTVGELEKEIKRLKQK